MRDAVIERSERGETFTHADVKKMMVEVEAPAPEPRDVVLTIKPAASPEPPRRISLAQVAGPMTRYNPVEPPISIAEAGRRGYAKQKITALLNFGYFARHREVDAVIEVLAAGDPDVVRQVRDAIEQAMRIKDALDRDGMTAAPSIQ